MASRKRAVSLLAFSGLLIAVLAAGASQAGATRGPAAAGRGHIYGTKAPKGHSVLYGQQSNDSGVGIVSQDFGDVGFDIYDSTGADDFTVPSDSTWTVTIVAVTGVYFNGPGPSPTINVTFYNDGGGKPGSVVSAQSITPGFPRGPTGVVRLGTPVVLGSGTYWVSFQAAMNFSPGGEYGWETTLTQSGAAAQWENPGNGFATGCTTWGNMVSCIGSLGEGPDFMFSLEGYSS